jgi:hypothetical protein
MNLLSSGEKEFDVTCLFPDTPNIGRRRYSRLNALANARHGYEFARRHHRPRCRMEQILHWVESEDKDLEKHVAGPLKFA